MHAGGASGCRTTSDAREWRLAAVTGDREDAAMTAADPSVPRRRPPRLVLALPWLLALLVAGCGPRDGDAAADAVERDNTRPAPALRQLTQHLRDDDFVAFARDAVPPDVHAELATAWREGRTRWPMDELPFGERLPALVGALSAPDANARYRKIFDRQFAGQVGELRSAAQTLGFFAVQYIERRSDLDAGERQHYAQLAEATSRWAAQAPLSDRARGHAALLRMTAAARRTGLGDAASYASAGLDPALRQLGPFVRAAKTTAAGYGLDLDASLDAADIALQAQTGDTAQVRLRYEVAGHPVDALVDMERIDGHWYVADHLRRARAAIARPAPAAEAPPAD